MASPQNSEIETDWRANVSSEDRHRTRKEFVMVLKGTQNVVSKINFHC